MATGHRTVKIDRSLVEEADRERGRVNRSLGGQIEHWARLGRALENAPRMSQDKIRRALASEITIDEFNDAETRAYFSRLAAAMQTPTEAEKAFYASITDHDDAPGVSEEELYGTRAHKHDDVAA